VDRSSLFPPIIAEFLTKSSPSLTVHIRAIRSDHSIMRRGAYREVYEFMTEFLLEKWGKGGRRRGW
jgi:hypothetical protein